VWQESLRAAVGKRVADQADHQLDQLRDVEGLGHETGDRRVQLDGSHPYAHHDHRDVSVLGVQAQLPVGLAPIDAGHHHIHQH
jgi:hypothetical protein